MRYFSRRKSKSFGVARQGHVAGVRSYCRVWVGLVFSLGAMGTACPQKVQTQAEAKWAPVSLPEQAPRGETPAQKEQRLTAQRAHLQAKGRKFKAALVLEEERVCRVDADCTLTTAHCCSCSAGGTQEGVAAQMLPQVLLRRGEVCGDIMCPQMISSHPSCDATAARCEKGICVPDVASGASSESDFGLGVETIPE